MKNKTLLKTFILIISLIATFFLAELVLRFSGFATIDVYKYDSKTGLTTLIPNLEFRSKTDCFDNLVKINSQGFHDSEFALGKREDVFRIAIVGDSFVEARNVPIEKSFQYVLEEKLNQDPGKKYEVYAFGIAGNGTFKNYLYLNQYVLKYKPDLVILAFLPFNDFRDDYLLLSKIFDENGKVKTSLPMGEKLISKSIFLTWLDYKWQVAKTSENFNKLKSIFSPNKTETDLPFDFQVFLKDYPESWQKIWDLEKTLITQFKETVEENQSKFLLVSLIDIWRAHPDLLAQDEQYGPYVKQFDLDLDKPEKLLEEFAKNENIPFLNLKDVLGERAKMENQIIFLYPCDGHWNERGNLWAGEVISDFLNQENNQKLITK